MKKIFITSSGFGLKASELKATKAYWGSLGFHLKSPLKTKERDFLCAASLKSRLEELKKAFSHPEVDLIWALRGGYGMQELLPEIKSVLKAREKTFIGYSDGTSLHYYLNSNGHPSVHGPHPNTFHLGIHNKKIHNDYSMLLKNPHNFSQVFKGLKTLNLHKRSRIEAPIIGGNLTTLQSLMGTKFNRGTQNKILFLEEVEEPAYKINRMLTHLEQAGFFKGLRALVFGHMIHSNKPEQLKIKKVMKRWSLLQKFPVLSGMKAGHKHKENHPFWLGKKSELVLDEEPRLFNNI